MVEFLEDTPQSWREDRAHQLVGAAGAIGEGMCERADAKFPHMTAEERAQLKLTATAACIVAATMALAVRELSSEERDNLRTILFDDLRAGDQLLDDTVDECEDYVFDLVFAAWDSGELEIDRLEGLDSALALWMGENAFGQGPVSPRMVQFAKMTGTVMGRQMDAFWDGPHDRESRK